MKKDIKVLTVTALMIALTTVTGMIKLFDFPTGGSITLFSMLFTALPGFFFGPIVGLISGTAYGFINFFMGPYVVAPAQVILDYGAFAVLAMIAGFFSKKKKGLLTGYLLGCAGRWFCSFLSGWIFFGEYAWAGWGAIAYSAVYNLIYIGTEAAITVSIISIPVVNKAITRAKTSLMQ